MTQRKKNPYARTYLFQTDGSAALKAQEVMDVPNQKTRDTAPGKQPLMLSIPVWGILLAAAVGVFLLAFLLLGMSSNAAQIHKEIYAARQAERDAQEKIEGLEVRIAQAESPEQIHSIAMNRLGMHRPTEDEIVYIPYAEALTRIEPEEAPAHDQGSVLRYLFGLLGL